MPRSIGVTHARTGQTDTGGGHLAYLCDIVVKKNRITTVTVSVLERPPRCQCRNGSGTDKACVS